MSESDQTSTLDPQAPAQPVLPPDQPAPEKPRFLDQVMGMRAVIAVALAALVIGGLSGFLLGEHTSGHDGFGRGGPGGLSRQGFGGPPGMSHQQWGHGQGQSQWGQQGSQQGGSNSGGSGSGGSGSGGSGSGGSGSGGSGSGS